MRMTRLAIVLTSVNFVVLSFVLARSISVEAQSAAPVLRGRALEIVDGHGRIRASITVEPAVTMNGRTYPETVLLRLTDPVNGPVVKITATAEGSALGLSDHANGGVQLHSTKQNGNFIKVVSSAGREQIIRP